MKKFLLIILCLFSQNIFASAVFPTGNEIYEVCTHLQDDPATLQSKNDLINASLVRGVNMGMCAAAVGTAFSAITDVGYPWAVNEKFSKCMSRYYGFDKFTGHQLLDMVIKYLKENPEYRNSSISVVMVLMLHDKFPSSVCETAPLSDITKN